MKGFLLALLIAAGLIGAAAMLGLVNIKFDSSSRSANAHDSLRRLPTPANAASDADIGDRNNQTDPADQSDPNAQRDAPKGEHPALREIRVKDRDEP